MTTAAAAARIPAAGRRYRRIGLRWEPRRSSPSSACATRAGRSGGGSCIGRRAVPAFTTATSRAPDRTADTSRGGPPVPRAGPAVAAHPQSPGSLRPGDGVPSFWPHGLPKVPCRPGVSFECYEQPLPRAEQPRAQRPNRPSQRDGSLLIGQLLDVDEEDRGAQGFGEVPERAVDLQPPPLAELR